VARRASALIVAGADPERAAAIGAMLDVARVFRLRRFLEQPRLVEPAGRLVAPAAGTRVLALAALARPQRFFDDLAEAGWMVAGQVAYADHQRYTPADVSRIVSEMKSVRAVMVLTTEKDLMRLLPLRPLPVPVAWAPMQVSIEPSADFRSWLSERLRLAIDRATTHGERNAGHGRKSLADSRKPV
jgi:tetraacyldisaccharide-1-P 4'-kinase